MVSQNPLWSSGHRPFQIVVKSQAGLALLGAIDADTRIDMESVSACVACRNMNGVCESNLCGWGPVCVPQSERELILSRLRLHTAVTFDGGCVRNFNAQRRRALRPPPMISEFHLALAARYVMPSLCRNSRERGSSLQGSRSRLRQRSVNHLFGDASNQRPSSSITMFLGTRGVVPLAPTKTP